MNSKLPDPKAPKGWPVDSGFADKFGPLPMENFDGDIPQFDVPLTPEEQAATDRAIQQYDKLYPGILTPHSDKK